ncbi:hypothetical protein PLICRDRAFT_52228 [Plicaturopsis crispa FD-325 SS-3]|nr:hypothetical protein PLICRDRAFT_52228 [Plicaturopsis crispa FD-325 SS-3]
MSSGGAVHALRLFTPERGLKWERLVTSDPARTVAAISLGAETKPNRWGDTAEDIFPACAAASSTATKGGARWASLVNAGIVDALCLNVIHMQHNFPGVDEEIRPYFEDQIRSSHFFPIEVLSNAALDISKSMRPSDLKTIAALRKHWPKMMNRIWKDPQNSLKPAKQHIEERTELPRIVGLLIMLEPSFSSTIDDEWDRTVQVLTRYWIHSTDLTKDSDTLMTLHALVEILNPHKDPVRAYRVKHPQPPSMFSRVVQGADGDVTKLLPLATEQLMRMDPREVLLVVRFVEALARMARDPKTRPAEHCIVFMLEYHTSIAWWGALFGLLRKATTYDTMGGGRGGWHVLAEKISEVVVAAFHGTLSESLDTQEVLIRIWVQVGIFQAWEEAAPRFAYLPGFNACLCTIFSGIIPLLNKRPAMMPAILSELPRPRLTRALRDPPPPQADPSRVYISDRTDHSGSAGALLRALEKACQVQSKCARRGCDKSSDKRCSKCRSAGYCSVECQKQDWKLHKLVCVAATAQGST